MQKKINAIRFLSLLIIGFFTSLAVAQTNVVVVPMGEDLLERNCPADMADAGIFCIDREKNPDNNWREQALLCQSEGKKLCSMAEWTVSCHTSDELGITDFLSGSLEYIDSSYSLLYIGSGYYSMFWSLGGSGGTCDRKYYSTWACTNSANCYNGNSINVGDSNYSGRCCLPK